MPVALRCLNLSVTISTMTDQEIDPARGQRIRDARNAKGWTQAELATEVEASPGSVKNWEAGKPIREHRVALERVLGITLRDSVGPTHDDAADKVLLDLPDGAFDGFTEIDREEALAAGRLRILEKAAEIRSRIGR